MKNSRPGCQRGCRRGFSVVEVGLATVIVGGLTCVLVLTLLVLPSFYLVLDWPVWRTALAARSTNRGGVIA